MDELNILIMFLFFMNIFVILFVGQTPQNIPVNEKIGSLTDAEADNIMSRK
jgi:hypothetical protein